MGSERDFKSMQDSVSASLVNTTRTAGQIAGEDLAFHRSSDPAITQLLAKQNARVLALVRSLTKIATTGTDISAPLLPDAEAVEDNWKAIVDIVDNLLEKTDSCLDEYTGVIKRLSPSQRDTQAPVAARKSFPAKEYKNQDIPKPQLLFHRVPDNQEVTAFRPLLRTKPHAIVPLEEDTTPLLSEDQLKEYKHPYEAEITQSTYPASTYIRSDPIQFLPFDSTTASFVDTLEGARTMLAELKTAKEIAVDLEHHDTHSYVGLVCLMQISTREKDWIVDTLKPWRAELQMLNDVFADPDIVKVFHGAFMDMIWLQRDLGLYVVGLFDTYHASHSLGYQQHSLASLLAKFAKFSAQKQYQMADWRMRPLPKTMFEYARSDTHFLLNIYDNMRNELVDKSTASQDGINLINVVLEESKKEALQKYERPIYDLQRGTGSNGWYNMLLRTPALFTRQQFATFREVHQWRDNVARRYDESPSSVMQKSVLYNIAREMPVDMPTLLGCSHPLSSFMRQHIEDLLGVVKRAKANGINGPDLKEFMRAYPANAERPAEKVHRAMSQPPSRTTEPQPMPVFSIGQIAESMRSERSSFWGPTINNAMSSSIHNPQSVSQQPDLRLALPLPQLTAEIFSDSGAQDINTIDTPLADPGSLAEHRYVKGKKPVENDVFIVKDIARRRNRGAIESHPASEPIPVEKIGDGSEAANGTKSAQEASHTANFAAMSPGEGRERYNKPGRRARKKAEKARRKEEAAQSKGTENNEIGGVEEPFDYASAPSVLHAKSNQRDGVGQQQAFNPYAKSLNAPRGMKRSNPETAGRSFTYKS